MSDFSCVLHQELTGREEDPGETLRHSLKAQRMKKKKKVKLAGHCVTLGLMAHYSGMSIARLICFLFQVLKEMSMEDPPEEEEVEEVVTVLQEVQDESIEDTWTHGRLGPQRGERSSVCIRVVLVLQ